VFLDFLFWLSGELRWLPFSFAHVMHSYMLYHIAHMVVVVILSD